MPDPSQQVREHLHGHACPSPVCEPMHVPGHLRNKSAPVGFFREHTHCVPVLPGHVLRGWVQVYICARAGTCMGVSAVCLCWGMQVVDYMEGQIKRWLHMPTCAAWAADNLQMAAGE